ncbi:MAG: SDR family oxidoreductase [Myxococcales bacterium]|nr:SDR family oxidoreductase [Myxococcales bacterium]
MTNPPSRVALVTGGASGIGRCLAERLVRSGAVCVVADRNQALVEETAAALGCHGVALDVRDVGQVAAAVAEITASRGPIDLLINSAGITRAGETHGLAYDDWKDVIDVNLYGVVNCVHAVYPQMVGRRAGQIVNIASIAGLFPAAGQVSYVASKYAVVGLSQALRAEAACHGVRVSVVCPGIIDTPMTRNLSVKAEKASRIEGLIPRGIPVERCADDILAGMERNDATILIGGLARSLYALNRASPRLAGALNELSVRFLNR